MTKFTAYRPTVSVAPTLDMLVAHLNTVSLTYTSALSYHVYEASKCSYN